MGLVDGFKAAHTFLKIAFITIIIAEIVNWVAFCTARWGEGRRDSNSGYYAVYGLWRLCQKNGIGCSPLDGWALIWYGCFQAFVTMGFLGLNLAFFFLILNMFVASCRKNLDMVFWAAIIIFVTAGPYVIGIIIFAAEFSNKFVVDYSFDFSFFLAIITVVLEIFAGIFLILASKASGVSPI